MPINQPVPRFHFIVFQKLKLGPKKTYYLTEWRRQSKHNYLSYWCLKMYYIEELYWYIIHNLSKQFRTRVEIEWYFIDDGWVDIFTRCRNFRSRSHKGLLIGLIYIYAHLPLSSLAPQPWLLACCRRFRHQHLVRAWIFQFLILR